MKRIHKIVAFILALAVLISAAMISTAAADSNKAQTGASGITIHYYSESGAPNIYYWNSLPDNIETDYPGPSMISEGNNWYKYTFSNKTKINILFVKNGVQSDELTRETGEWWYKNNRWYSKDPNQTSSYERTDMREDSIYFVIPTRFYDGDNSNNVHCWDDGKANNPDSDPAWRGDFKGLIEKLDYIKALGFSAIWVTPVVENASGYDYHGYHALNFSKIDPRYESNGATFQDLIDACHEKGIKLIQDVVWNHTGNWGENYLCPMFTKDYSKDLSTADCMKMIPGSEIATGYPNYASLDGSAQFQARLDVIQGIHSSGKYNTKAYYHDAENAGWGQATEQTGSIEGDCRDLNTENQPVADYIYQAYSQYVDMGVDAFRLDTEKHINRWTLNSAYFPRFINSNNKNFFIFGEVCARWSEYINEGGLSDSPFFYTWKETNSKWMNNWSTTPFYDSSHNGGNIKLSMDHYSEYNTRTPAETSTNAFLNGVSYHTPDYSKWNGTGVIDFTMHWNFENANKAFDSAKGEDHAFNDSTWNVTYVDSHDYAPDFCQKVRYTGGEQAWAENMDLMFTFRGIPCVYYGSEIQFQAGQTIDEGPNKPLADTGRAYYGDNIEGSVTATGFGTYTSASGAVQTTLNKPLCQHLSQLNQIRRAVPALQKGQYTTSNVNNGNIAYTRRYTANGVDSLACVAISGGATFSGLPNGKYIDAVTGAQKTVSNGTLTSDSVGKGNMRVWVCCASGFKGISGKIGTNGTYLK
ncbi:MAG: starch-binding protein [Ruminococcus sp.]|nr:starch-binding protein [Ruminococcus sp.]